MTGAPIRVFVYGTLMPGGSRWPYLRRYAASWQPATAPGQLWDTGHGYPAATFDDDGDGDADGRLISGVAVMLTPDTGAEALRLLDEIEGEGSLYRRVEVATSAGTAFSYEWLGSTAGFEPLPGGWTS